MKEFRIKMVRGKGPAGRYVRLCDDRLCMNEKKKNSNYCTLHARDEWLYRVQRKILGFWINVSRRVHAELKDAESEMISLADGIDASIVSTWRLRDDGILEQTS